MYYLTHIIRLVIMCTTHWSTFLAHVLRNLGCASRSYARIFVLTAQILGGRNIRVIRVLTERANTVLKSTAINKLQYATVHCTQNQVSFDRVHVELICVF